MQPNLPKRLYSASVVAEIAGMLPHCMASPTAGACLLEINLFLLLPRMWSRTLKVPRQPVHFVLNNRGNHKQLLILQYQGLLATIAWC